MRYSPVRFPTYEQYQQDPDFWNSYFNRLIFYKNLKLAFIISASFTVFNIAIGLLLGH